MDSGFSELASNYATLKMLNAILKTHAKYILCNELEITAPDTSHIEHLRLATANTHRPPLLAMACLPAMPQCRVAKGQHPTPVCRISYLFWYLSPFHVPVTPSHYSSPGQQPPDKKA